VAARDTSLFPEGWWFRTPPGKNESYSEYSSGLQKVRSSKRPVAKKHPYIFCTCRWWKSAGSVAAMFAGKGMAVFYSLF
jgi:hypothetical protein